VKKWNITIMDPGKKDTLEDYEKNAKRMYLIGFGLIPLSWLMCWIYCFRRRKESEYLDQLGKKCFVLWWVAVLVFGLWTALYHAFWDKMTIIGFNVPYGDPE
jgi:hypothetical protein